MAGINLFLDTRRQKTDGTYPIKLLVAIGSKTVNIPLNICVSKEEWDEVGKQVINNSQAKLFNRVIENKVSQLKLFLSELNIRHIKIKNPVELKKYFEEGILPEQYQKTSLILKTPYLPSINDTAAEKIVLHKGFVEYFEKVISEKHAGTQEVYIGTLKTLLKYQKNIDTFETITYSWLKNFEQYLLSQGLKKNSVSIHFRNIRAVFNEAIKEDIITQNLYPFRKFKISFEQTKHRNFSVEELIPNISPYT
ncbi:MAG: phage integrase SAM-like domain-containing protein [Bacteroidales bacterium]|jgi:hypothetical protein|nr:phage integrase SAM-like domain-containing protein [Bacteroidales bacterium]